MIIAIVLLYFIIAFTFLIGFYYFAFHTEEGYSIALEIVGDKLSNFDNETIERLIRSRTCKFSAIREFSKKCLLWPKLITDAMKRRKSRRNEFNM